MKQLNKVQKPAPVKLTMNPEGAVAYQVPSDLALFLVAASFKLKPTFYADEQDKLVAFETLIDKVGDLHYKAALSKYLANDLGIRLAPVIILTREALRIKDANNPSQEHRDWIKRAVSYVFDRGDKFANSFAYVSHFLGREGEVTYLPAFYKRALKDAFEKLNVNALNKYKLLHREVKLADVIKILHPKPNNKGKAEAYKNLIENKLKQKDTIVAVLSDDNLTKEQKDKWINENSANVPVNAFLRNLRNIPATKENAEVLKKKLEAVLQIKEGLPGLKYINPFDVLVAGIECNVPLFTKVITEVLSNWADNINLGLDGKKVSLLVDVSGSMMAERIKNVAKYFALLFPALRNSEVSLFKFNTKLTKLEDNVVRIFKLSNPLSTFEVFKTYFVPMGGTALADCVRECSKTYNPDLMIVFSDEVSWADESETYLKAFDVPNNVIAINPEAVKDYSVFSPKKQNLIKLAGLDAKILFYTTLLGNFNKFKIIPQIGVVMLVAKTFESLNYTVIPLKEALRHLLEKFNVRNISLSITFSPDNNPNLLIKAGQIELIYVGNPVTVRDMFVAILKGKL